jgi:hypothetical protein
VRAWLKRKSSTGLTVVAVSAVKEFAEGYDAQRGVVTFRGASHLVNKEVVWDAFCLPTGRFVKFSPSRVAGHLDSFFTHRSPGNPYIVQSLKAAYGHWGSLIRVLNELLLYKRKPNQIVGKEL